MNGNEYEPAVKKNDFGAGGEKVLFCLILDVRTPAGTLSKDHKLLANDKIANKNGNYKGRSWVEEAGKPEQ